VSFSPVSCDASSAVPFWDSIEFSIAEIGPAN
jgi:hypothetical protein